MKRKKGLLVKAIKIRQKQAKQQALLIKRQNRENRKKYKLDQKKIRSEKKAQKRDKKLKIVKKIILTLWGTLILLFLSFFYSIVFVFILLSIMG